MWMRAAMAIHSSRGTRALDGGLDLHSARVRTSARPARDRSRSTRQGYSEHANRYPRDDYRADFVGLRPHLGLSAPVVLIGNSPAGANAYPDAGRHAEGVPARTSTCVALVP